MSSCFSCYDNLVKLENDTTISAHKNSFQILILVDSKDVLKTTD